MSLERVKVKRSAGIVIILSFSAGVAAAAQNCTYLRGGSPDVLTSHLTTVKPDQMNAPCVESAIKQLGDLRHEPAAPVLTKFLQFRWPPDARQKQRRFVLEYEGESIYPAATALEKIGKNALPAVIDAIKSGSLSREGMQVAVSVWMTIYKDQSPLGVALLKQEADKITQPIMRQRVGYAAYLAARDWCTPSEKSQCMIAAQTNYFNQPSVTGKID